MMAGYQHLTAPAADSVFLYASHGDGSKWLSPTGAAYRRILNQDYTEILQSCRQRGIDSTVTSFMVEQLAEHCGATSDNFEVLVREGAQLIQRSFTLNDEEQLRWVPTDLHVRQAIQDLDLQRSASHGFEISQAPSDRAIMLRSYVNGSMIDILQYKLSQQFAHKIAEITTAVSNSGNPLLSAANKPAVERMPLAQASSNLPSRKELAPATTEKRKREDDMQGSGPSRFLPGSDSDDENALEEQAAGLQAKIASIRARTADEDVSMPRKKARKAKLKNTSAASLVRGSQLPSQQPTAPAHLLVQPKMEAELPPATVTDKSAVSSSNGIKLILRRQGKPDYRCKASMNTTFEKIITVARKEFEIPVTQAVCLHFEGQRLSAAELVREAGLRDYACLKVFDLPAANPHNTSAVDLKTENKMFQDEAVQQRQIAGAVLANLRPMPPVVDLTSSSPPQHVSPAAAQAQPPPPPPPQSEPKLCGEQQEVVDAILAGKNVFYTGSAGCGKSTVLKAFVPRLRELGKTVRIIAPTGKAALDINGSTTWTYAGWTPGHMKRPLDELVNAAHGKFVSKRFRDTDVLVIDEVSMVENHLLTRLSKIMQAARGRDLPFGGVQLVVTGDFCQLPPVKPFQFCMTCGREQIRKVGPRGETLYRCPLHGDCNDDDKWAFRSAVWEDCKFKHVNLTNIHRQSDEVFIGILQKLRIGKPLTNADRQLLLDHPCDVKNAVKLFPTREEVRRINQTEFDRLKTAKREFRCLDYFSWNETHGNLREKGRRSPVDNSLEALREHRLDTLVEFKAGMLVVLLVNLDIANGLVNGSQGRVIGFEPYAESKLPKAAVREGGGRLTSFSRSSGKKSRYGRETSPEPSESMVQGELRGEYAELRQGQIQDFILQPRNQNKMWPIVEFDNGLRRTVYADCQVNELGDEKPYTLLARTQIPLIAAWAMTIHKSQGMTLNRVIVDLGRSFEEGQEYVALSRARSLEGLKVMGLGENVGKGGNAQVKQFLKEKFNLS
ncbi:ATP-dependent DNA helicase PIF1 [Cercospora beticola]|uniref:ATP-dependent DNA helicase n=1 Tax=Cercospora beticola TaxID=122368 RepID=A0A2G5I4N5_CERBT|nr:ATP-dependent DNA helicase PIF1 [Cercospora beticola]PIA99718.1 ATP-dependent DNA helicase PIF1 [Cercospora beticola]